jgi:hypothetical protein
MVEEWLRDEEMNEGGIQEEAERMIQQEPE